MQLITAKLVFNFLYFFSLFFYSNIPFPSFYFMILLSYKHIFIDHKSINSFIIFTLYSCLLNQKKKQKYKSKYICAVFHIHLCNCSYW
jgi:hypothetical protein